MKTLHKITLLAVSAAFFFSGCKKESLTQSAKSTTSANNFSVAADSLIQTPSGLMPKSQVHLIEPGYRLDITDNHVLKIEIATGRKIADLGRILPASTNQNGSTPVTGKGFHNLYSSTSPSGNGWATYSMWGNSASQPINYFSTNWYVPTVPPSNDGQLIYIWNGLEPYQVDTNPNNLVLQPVLQWGANGSGTGTFGGQYWTISNWCVWNGGGAYTTPITHIAPGTNLQGVLTYNSFTAGSYNYTSAFTGYSNSMNVTKGTTYSNLGSSSPIAIPTIPAENWAYEVLEVFNVIKATDYPNELYVDMGSIKLQTGPPGVYTPALLTWTPYITSGIATFGEHTKVVSSDPGGTVGRVQLFFHPDGPYTFGVVTYKAPPSNVTYFNIIVNGNNISGPRGTAPQGQTNNVMNTDVAIEPNSTVVMQVTSGYMPVSAIIRGPFPDVNGVISGNTITFNNVNLSIGSSCALILN